MSAQLEVINSIERRLELVLPLNAVEGEVNTRLRKLAQKVKIDGFRPGKVPLSVVARMHADGVRQEVLGDTLQQQFSDAVRNHQLRVAGYPSFSPAAADAGELRFSASFEIYPEVVIGDLSAQRISRLKMEIGDAEIDRTLDVLRQQRRGFVAVDRAAQVGDQVTFDFVGRLNGEVFPGGEGQNFTATLGEGRLIKDFESSFDGLAAGDEKTFDATFPADYQAAELAGKTAQFSVKVHAVAAPRIPELDADFARTMGVESGDLAQLRSEVAANLRRETERRIKAKVKEQVMKLLGEQAALEVPKSLVKMEVERLVQQTRADLASRGMGGQEIPLATDMFEAQALQRVRLGITLAHIIDSQQLVADARRVSEMIEDFAQSYENPQEVVTYYYSQPERMREVESLALEENVVEWVMGQVQVEEVMTTFEELMGRS
jgi:trigger factor